MTRRCTVVLNAAQHAARLAEMTAGLAVDIRHASFAVPWEEIAARRAGTTTGAGSVAPELAAALRDAEVLFAFAPPLDVTSLAPRLRWVETPATGCDQLNGTGVLERHDIAVTTIGGLFAPWVAEHVFALLLALWRRIDEFARAQRSRTWIGRGVEVRELRDATMAIVGLGNIGQAVARAAQAFGMRVIGTRRHAGEVPAHVDRVFPRQALHAMLGEADVVVLAVTGTSETVHLIGAAELAAMRPEAVLINVARGTVVDEGALAAALAEHRLAGAGLDVFVREPLPADSPLWTLPNVLLTPHIAVNVPSKLRRCVEHFADNLRRYEAGGDLLDRIAR